MKLNVKNHESFKGIGSPEIPQDVKTQIADTIRHYLPENILSLEKTLLDKNGEFVSIELDREVETYKNSNLKGRIRKISKFTAQADIDYSNKQSTKEAWASGERERKPNINDIHLSKVLIYNANTDKIRFGFGTVKNPLCQRIARFELDGIKIDKDSILSELTANEKKEKPPTDWLTLLPDNIKKLNRQKMPTFEE